MELRIEVEAFRQDEPVEVQLQRRAGDNGAWDVVAGIALPERIAARLHLLGRAYELPLLSRLPWNPAEDDGVYAGVQLGLLADEAVALENIVADPALGAAIDSLVGLLSRARESANDRLVVYPP